MKQMHTSFLPGDKVTVLPYDEISNKFDCPGVLPSGCRFRDEMKVYCENTYTIKRMVSNNDDVGFYQLLEIDDWCFTDEMFIAQVPETTTDITISFDDVMNFSK